MEWIDEKILKYLNFDNGIYIECGANDGIRQSNTYLLENRQNWNGILIDASKSSLDKCKLNRNDNNYFFNCALVSSDYDLDYVSGDFDGNLMSSVFGKRLNRKSDTLVESRTLTSILDEVGVKKIDFFSLDVEGYELNVLKGLDFKKYKPTYILIEIYEKDKQEINEYMFDNDYELICNLSGFNLDNNPHWDGTHNDYLFKIK